MRSPIPDYLTEALEGVAADTSGQRADYIPELATADPDRLGAVFATADGEVYGAGDVDVEFTIQSISKPFAYALALADRGFEAVLAKVGVEPSGEAFNEMSLEGGSGRPLNPMINAGAITAHALAGQATLGPAERLEHVVDGLSAFAGRRLAIDEAVASSEMEHAHRNLAIAHMLRSHTILTEDPRTVVEGYTRQCSVLVTARDLAVMAATLANHGVNPLTGERVVSEPVVRQVLSVMSTCGMYDAAGDWATQVGIPAKSGVAGGLIGALPGQIGIATFSPRLDAHGNSVRGVSLFERFSTDMGMHVMEVPAAARSVVRSNHVIGSGPGAIRVLRLQGGIRFAGAERVVREAVQTAPTEPRVALDLSLVYSIDDVGRRMLLEVVRRLTLEGREVYLVDPEGIVPDPDPGDGGRVSVVREVGQIDTADQPGRADDRQFTAAIEELLELEHRGWASLCEGTGARFYGQLMTEDGVMVLAHGMALDRGAVIASLDDAPTWDEYTITGERLVTAGPDAAVLVYTGRAVRGEDRFEALMSSHYVRRDGTWRLAIYQQTAIPEAQ